LKQEYAFALDLKGTLPKWHMNNVAGPAQLEVAYALQSYFALQLRAALCTPEDAAFLGNVLVDTFDAAGRSHSDQAVAVSTFVLRCRLLQAEPFPTLGALLLVVLKGKAKATQESGSSSSLVGEDVASLTMADVKVIGHAFCAVLTAKLVAAQSAESVVAEWLGRHGPLRKFAKQNKWFAPMLESIAHRRMGTVSSLRRLSHMARNSIMGNMRVMDDQSSPSTASNTPNFDALVSSPLPSVFLAPFLNSLPLGSLSPLTSERLL
jgi:hypothetical protein